MCERASLVSTRATGLAASSTFALVARIASMRAEGRAVLSFGAGEPDFDTPDPIKDAAIDALRRGETGYQTVAGPRSVREVIAAKLARENGIPCSAEQVIVSSGAKQSLYLSLLTTIDPGDEVLVPTPAWVSYAPMVQLAGGIVVELPSRWEDGFAVDPAAVESHLSPRTRAIILNTPSNPCGTMYSRSVLEGIAEVVARSPGVAIIADEIYEKLIFGEAPHVSIGSFTSVRDRVITVNGLSKAYAMTGWRLGYACGPTDVIQGMARLQGQMTSHPTSFLFPAITCALESCASEVEAMRATFAERAELIRRLLSAMPGVQCPQPAGAFYAFPDVSAHFGTTTPAGRRVTDAPTFAAALLEEAAIAVLPGTVFGKGGERHIRLSYACPTSDIDEGCRRIAHWIESLGR